MCVGKINLRILIPHGHHDHPDDVELLKHAVLIRVTVRVAFLSSPNLFSYIPQILVYTYTHCGAYALYRSWTVCLQLRTHPPLYDPIAIVGTMDLSLDVFPQSDSGACRPRCVQGA
jgi:hypothetical protein